MTISQIINQHVQVAAHTITVKADGKTAGMVRGVTQWSKAQPNMQFEHSRVLRKSGIWDMANNKPWLNLLDRVFIINHNLYLIANLRTYADNADFYAAAGAAGIIVIPCYID